MKVKTLLVMVIIMSMACMAHAESLVVMGWDGAGLKNVNRLLDEGKLPNLARLINSGGHLVPLETLGATCTVPNWTMFFTGLTADQTGVSGNDKYSGNVVPVDGVDGKIYLNFWLRPIKYSETWIKGLQDSGKSVFWIGSKGYMQTDCEKTALCHLPEHADAYHVVHPRFKGDPYIEKIEYLALKYIQGSDNYFMFVHVNPDIYGHLFGEDSQRYEEEFIRADNLLGKIMDIVSPDTKIVAIADHGFDEGGFHHDNAPDLWMATNLPIHSSYEQQPNQRAFATLRDVPMTIMSYFGIPKTTQHRGISLLETQ